MAKRLKAHKNITRIKNLKNRRDEYWVRIQRGGEQICNRHFYDADYGDSRLALTAAQIYRDSMLIVNPKMSRQQFARRKMRNNTSGTTGVQKIIKDTKLESNSISYRVRWIPKKGGKRISATFTVAEHGEDAERLAIEARERGITEMRES